MGTWPCPAGDPWPCPAGTPGPALPGTPGPALPGPPGLPCRWGRRTLPWSWPHCASPIARAAAPVSTPEPAWWALLLLPCPPLTHCYVPSPTHVQVWEALLLLPWQPSYDYAYGVVRFSDDGNAVAERWVAGPGCEGGGGAGEARGPAGRRGWVGLSLVSEQGLTWFVLVFALPTQLAVTGANASAWNAHHPPDPPRPHRFSRHRTETISRQLVLPQGLAHHDLVEVSQQLWGGLGLGSTHKT